MTDRPTFPVFNVDPFLGIQTKVNRSARDTGELEISQNTDYFRIYQGVTKLRGSKRLLSSIYQESAQTKPISSVLFYKAVQASGQIQRSTLLACGTRLALLNDDGSLNFLTAQGTRTSGLVHNYDIFDHLMLIQNQDPRKVGAGDKPVKFDGKAISNWGVTPPGQDETVVFNFNSPLGANTTAGYGPLTVDTDVTWDGTAWKLQKTSVLANRCSAQSSDFTPWVVPTQEFGQVICYVYIERGDLVKLSTTGYAIQVFFSSDSGVTFNNFYRFDFPIGNLQEGWNKLSFSFKVAPNADGLNGGQVGFSQGTFTGTVSSIRFLFNTNQNSDLITVGMSHLATLDTAHPTVALGSAGSVFAAGGSWKYTVTFISKNGIESNMAFDDVAPNQRGAITVDGTARQNLLLTNIPVSSDPGIIARNIYRTVNGGTDYFLVGTIPDNSTTTFTDSAADTATSNVVNPPQAADLTNDNTPPPKCGIVKVWKRTVFLAGDPLNPNILYYSRDNNAEAFPLVNQFEFDAAITGIFETSLGLVICTDNDYWRIVADNPDYVIDKVSQGAGCVGPRACGTARFSGFAINRESVRFYDLRQTVRVSDAIEDQIFNLKKNFIEKLYAIYSRKMNGLIISAPNVSGDFTSIFMWQQFSDSAKGWWSTIATPVAANLNFLDFREIEDSAGNWRIYTGGNDGMAYELFSEDATDWVDAAGATYPVVLEIQTPYIRPGALQGDGSWYLTGSGKYGTGRVVPRLVEIRAEEENSLDHNWTVLIETAQGPGYSTTLVDSQTLTFNFAAGASLVRIPTQNLIPAEFIRLTITHQDAGRNVSLLGVRVGVQSGPGQFVVTE